MNLPGFLPAKNHGTTLVITEVKYHRTLGFRRLHIDEVERTAPSHTSQNGLCAWPNFIAQSINMMLN